LKTGLKKLEYRWRFGALRSELEQKGLALFKRPCCLYAEMVDEILDQKQIHDRSCAKLSERQFNQATLAKVYVLLSP